MCSACSCTTEREQVGCKDHLQPQSVCDIVHSGASWVVLRVLGVVCCTTVVQHHALELDLQHKDRMMHV